MLSNALQIKTHTKLALGELKGLNHLNFMYLPSPDNLFHPRENAVFVVILPQGELEGNNPRYLLMM